MLSSINVSDAPKRFPVPRTFREQREAAQAQAARYKATHDLADQEIAIVDSVIFDKALFPQNEGRELALAIAEVEEFRAARQLLGTKLGPDVDFLPESAWPTAWHDERRLSVLFRPTLEERDELGRHRAWIESGLGDFRAPKELALAQDMADFASTAQYQPEWMLRWISFYPHEEPFLWKGSGVRIEESDRAPDSGRGPIPKQTEVSMQCSLAAPTFAFLADLVRKHTASLGKDDALWLAMGFPFDGAVIPHRRPVEPEQVLPDPAKIAQPLPRLSLQLARVSLCRDDNSPPVLDPLGHWMAVERFGARADKPVDA